MVKLLIDLKAFLVGNPPQYLWPSSSKFFEKLERLPEVLVYVFSDTESELHLFNKHRRYYNLKMQPMAMLRSEIAPFIKQSSGSIIIADTHATKPIRELTTLLTRLQIPVYEEGYDEKMFKAAESIRSVLANILRKELEQSA